MNNSRRKSSIMLSSSQSIAIAIIMALVGHSTASMNRTPMDPHVAPSTSGSVKFPSQPFQAVHQHGIPTVSHANELAASLTENRLQFMLGYVNNLVDLIEAILTQEEQNLVEMETSSGDNPAANLTEQCHAHLSMWVRETRRGTPWAIKMFDAMGKPMSGIMEASLTFLGDYGECVHLGAERVNNEEEVQNVPKDQMPFNGQYCLATVQIPTSTLHALTSFSGLSSKVWSRSQAKIGLCTPSTCSPSEIIWLFNRVTGSFLRNASASLDSCHQASSYQISEDKGAQIYLYFLAGFIGIILIGTVFDYCRQRRSVDSYHVPCDPERDHVQKLNNVRYWSETDHSFEKDLISRVSLTGSDSSALSDVSSLQPLTMQKERSSLISKILLAFSLKRNWRLMTSCENRQDSIEAFHGLRVLCMLWIICGHSYSFAMQWLFFRNPEKLRSAPQNPLSQVLANGTFSVDCFLYLSGFLVAYHTMKYLSKHNGKFNFFSYALHRYMRMTPLMMAIIGFCVTILRYVGEGPNWSSSIIMFDDWCRDNWWINALYLHNFINRQQMCLSHSWYSAVDFQLYLIAPLILIPLYKWRKFGSFVLSLFLGASMFITGYLTLFNHFPAVPYFSDIIPQEVVNEYYGAVYIKPYCRMGPYLVGMLAGYLIAQYRNKINITKIKAFFGWIVCVTVMLGVLFAMLPAMKGQKPDETFAAIYSATARSLWAAGLAWITFACVGGAAGSLNSMLSWPGWKPLSRLTYAAYLIHPIVMAAFYGSREDALQFSHFLMSYFVIGNIIITYAISMVASLLFESPFMALEKLFSS